MGERVKKPPTPAPTPTPAPQRTLAPAPPGGARSKLDSTAAIRLVLRSIAERARAANKQTGELKPKFIALAASECAVLLGEITQLGKLESPDWQALHAELGDMFAQLGPVRAQLGTDGELARTELDASVLRLKEVVPQKLLDQRAANVKPLKGLDAADHLELARQALAAVTREVAVFRNLKQGDDRQQTLELMQHLPSHFRVAAASAARVPKKPRMALYQDLNLAVSGMSDVAKFLTGAPRAPWHRIYAAAFDAELFARETIGEAGGVVDRSERRPYTGTIDPGEALATITDLAKGTHQASDLEPSKLTTPKQAVAAISVAMDYVYDQQYAALTQRLKPDLGEPGPPKDVPLWQTLLSIAVNVAISMAGGALASYISNRFIQGALTTRALNSKLSPGALMHVDTDWQSALLKDTTISRAVTNDYLKDGIKELFKSSAKEFLAALPAKAKQTNAREPLNAFIQLQSDAIADSKARSKFKLIENSNALAQADVTLLAQLAHFIYGTLGKEAGALQYDRSMLEWQNLKARMDAGSAKSNDQDPYAHGAPNKSKKETAPKLGVKPERDAAIDEDDKSVLGAFELTANVHGEDRKRRSSVDYTFRSLKLPGGEAAARRHLKAKNVPILELAMNKHFVLNYVWTMGSATVRVGVGPDQGLYLPGISAEEMKILRIYAEPSQVSWDTVHPKHHTDHQKIPDRIALSVLVELLQKISKEIKTQKLED